ncbi:pectinesterase family protein [Vibrio sp. ABG19]|uniref:pectinesterase family protein n=1 Tax=Vibrio sp. ABG19 TaxID=2817385 RepID=UPI00249EE412|nr:pectinesterase family protein [Vibrio sp. ABG19]WGY45473.1 pectin esterase [Vibrio sp. ABG19]
MNRYQIALGVSALLYGGGLMAVPLYDVVVAQDGSGDFISVQQAIDAAPRDNQQFVIYIRNGVYKERLNISRDRLYLIGEDREHTIITASYANGTLDKNGVRMGTSGSRTVYVDANDFKARTLTIENGFDFIANQAKSDDDPSKLQHTQAVALMVSRTADRAQFKDVNLVGYQDTLYLRGGRSVFEQSRISGTVDFIFGHGTGLFKQAEIIARDRDDVESGGVYGYITAPSTNINQPFGLVFKDCRIIKEPGVPANSYGLGRPWHPTTTFSDGRYADPNAIGHAAFINCEMDNHIYGWDRMSGKDINQQPIWFYPSDSRFWEYGNWGEGAVSVAQRPQLSDEDNLAYQDNVILAGWEPDLSLGSESELQGEVLHQLMQFPSQVTVKDSLGQQSMVDTDQRGRYRISIAGMTPPLLISADDHSGASCLHSDQPRSICVSALVADVVNNGITTGNVNAFSDLQVSELAEQAGIDGPQQLLGMEGLPVFSRSVWLQTKRNFIDFSQQTEEKFSPVDYSEQWHQEMKSLSNKVIHNRGYNSQTGLANQVSLTDLAFQPILSLEPGANYLKNKTQLALAQQRITEADTRLFIVGDSTASNYEPDVYPRMGWGQALAAKLTANPSLSVVNAARSGRSSRDYINGLWLSYLRPLVKPGDYLFIQFGHNDEKCNGAKAKRGVIDVANLCTYPNDVSGLPQFEQGEELLSFQHSLERYIAFALEHKMHPVLLTSVPRVLNADNQAALPITANQHITRQNSQQGYKYVGSYYQTVLDTAQYHQLPLLDIQQRVVSAANQHGNWRQLWLAVDSAEFPYYLGRTGSLEKPDTTHFQQQGAEMVADLVLDEIQRNQALKKLARKLKIEQ